MGAGLTKTFVRVIPESGAGSTWVKNARGPTLRKLLGAYENPDIWAVYRRLRRLDAEGSGWMGYDELQELLPLPEFNLLFLWDLFSHQNELINGREILAAVCVFSSATLTEKGRFLITIFDDSHTGSCTGAEVAQACVAALNVLARCTCCVVKPKEITGTLRDELPGLLPEYRKAVQRRGGDRQAVEKAFHSERVISQAELDTLLTTVQSSYAQLPVAGKAPEGAIKPPPPDWGAPPALTSMLPQAEEEEPERMEEDPDHPDSDSFAVSMGGAAGGARAAVRALTNSRSGARLMTESQAMSQQDDEDGDGPRQHRAMAAAANLIALEKAADAAEVERIQRRRRRDEERQRTQQERKHLQEEERRRDEDAQKEIDEEVELRRELERKRKEGAQKRAATLKQLKDPKSLSPTRNGATSPLPVEGF